MITQKDIDSLNQLDRIEYFLKEKEIKEIKEKYNTIQVFWLGIKVLIGCSAYDLLFYGIFGKWIFLDAFEGNFYLMIILVWTFFMVLGGLINFWEYKKINKRINELNNQFFKIKIEGRKR